MRPDIVEKGEIVTVDCNERMIEKLTFSGAKVVSYRLHFDANTQDAVAAIVTIDVKGTKTQGRAVDVETTGSKEGSAGIEKTYVLLPQLIWFGDEADKEKSNAWGKHRFDKDN